MFGHFLVKNVVVSLQADVTNPIQEQNTSFSSRLNSCLLLQKQYRDMFRTLRDTLGAVSSGHSSFVLAPGSSAVQHVAKRSILYPGYKANSQTNAQRLPSNTSTLGNFVF